MKKKIITCVFLLLIVITAISFISAAIRSYNYDMDPANGVDLLEGVGAVLISAVGGFVIFYELDLYYTVYYFFIKPKTVAKSILNVLSNLSLLTVFFTDSIAHFLYDHVSKYFGEEIIVLFASLCMYIVLRIAYAMVCDRQSTKEK